MSTLLLPEVHECRPEEQALRCMYVPSHHRNTEYASIHADTHLRSGPNAHAIRLVLCLLHVCP